MNLKDKIFVAGHSGLVGSAICRSLKVKGFSNVLTSSREELDLTNQAQVGLFFKDNKPDFVILAAAKVGGIHANNTYPAEFIYQNLMIESNIINSAYENKVERLLFLGSTCIYPSSITKPIKEEDLLSNYLEQTNEPYALAKIAGIKLCESYNRQYGTDFRSVMPTNLYGRNDNFHPENSHVIPALMQRFHTAKITNAKNVTVWGTGNAMREFMYVDDMVEASLFVFALDKDEYIKNTSPMISHINIGTGSDVSIKKLAMLMKEIVNFKGEIIFDQTKPDGAKKKLVDITRLTNMGWTSNINLKKGLEITYDWYKSVVAN